MKAAVMYGVGQPLVIEDLDIQEPQAGEVLVKTSASGVCHSDLHFMEGSWMFPTPVVLGHESAGVVEKVGAGVTNVKPGDRVVIAFVASCGTCDRCITGRPVLCTNASPMGRVGRISKGGTPVFQFAGMGAFGAQQLVDAKACVKVPDGVPMEVACLVGCSVMTGVGAVRNAAGVKVGDSVAVIGCGGVGVQVVSAASLAGAARVIAIDRDPAKLELAHSHGATDVLLAGDDVVRDVHALTDGGTDHAIEVVGRPETIRQAFAMIREGGTAVVVGIAPRGVDVAIPALDFISDKTLRGCFYGSGNVLGEMPSVVSMVASGRLRVSDVVSDVIGLDGIEDAFQRLRDGRGARSLVVLDSEAAGGP